MATRAVWHPPWHAWVAAGIAALAFTRLTVPRLMTGHWLAVTPIVVLLGVLAMRKLWQLPPAVMMCAAIATTIFSGGWSKLGLGGLPVDRLLLVTVFLQLLLRSPGVAHVPRIQLRNVHLLMGLVLLYVTISAVASGTLTNETNLLSLVDQLGLAPYLAFLFAPVVFSGRKERNMLLGTLVGVGAYLGFTAIFESIGPHALVFPRYIVRIDSELPGERAGGPFQSSVAEGFSTFSCAVAAMIAFVQWRGDGLRRYCAATVTLVCVGGCFLTLERGVWLGALAGTVVVALATRAGRRWLVPGALALALLIGGALVISPSLSNKTSHRVEDKLSVWDRQNQTSTGLRMVASRPLFGFGWGRYTTDNLDYFREGSDYPMTGYTLNGLLFEKPLPLHDSYLSYAVELGLLGAVLWLLALLWGVGEAIFSRGAPELRPWKLGMAAMLVFFLVVSAVNPYQQEFPVLLLWVWAGAALGSESLQVQHARARARVRAGVHGLARSRPAVA
jgi:putative inorganic carbon (hco3(-)) transporter